MLFDYVACNLILCNKDAQLISPNVLSLIYVNHVNQNLISILQSELTKRFSFVLSSEKRSLRKKHVGRIFSGRRSHNLKA